MIEACASEEQWVSTAVEFIIFLFQANLELV